MRRNSRSSRSFVYIPAEWQQVGLPREPPRDVVVEQVECRVKSLFDQALEELARDRLRTHRPIVGHRMRGLTAILRGICTPPAGRASPWCCRTRPRRPHAFRVQPAASTYGAGAGRPARRRQPRPARRCRPRRHRLPGGYSRTWDNGSGFGANVTIENLGDPLTGWALGFASAATSGSPTAGRARGRRRASASRRATPRGTATWPPTAPMVIGFNGTYAGANTDPSAFTLNGTVCTGSRRSPRAGASRHWPSPSPRAAPPATAFG